MEPQHHATQQVLGQVGAGDVTIALVFEQREFLRYCSRPALRQLVAAQ